MQPKAGLQEAGFLSLDSCPGLDAGLCAWQLLAMSTRGWQDASHSQGWAANGEALKSELGPGAKLGMDKPIWRGQVAHCKGLYIRVTL